MSPEERAARLAPGPDGLRASPGEIAAEIREAEQAAREATMDEFGILHGAAATSFLAEMERVRSPEEVAAHSAFTKECETVYRESQEKRPGSPESEVKRLRVALGQIADVSDADDGTDVMARLERCIELAGQALYPAAVKAPSRRE